MADWNETKAILQELEQLFNRDDDLKDIADIQKMGKEIDLHLQNQIKETKDIIKGIQTYSILGVFEINFVSYSDDRHCIEERSRNQSSNTCKMRVSNLN